MHRTVLTLGWVSFFMDVSSEMIYPLIPVFLASTLGASVLTIGLIAGLSESTASFFRIASGAISDRMRRRKTAVAAGYLLSTASRPVLALAGGWIQVLVFRLLDRAGKGVRTPPRDALIADTTTPETYGCSYGYHRAMDTAGAILGPAAASAAIWLGFGMRTVFWASLAPAAAAVAVVLLFIRETPRRGTESGAQERGGRGAGFSRKLKLFLLVTAVFSLGNSSNFFLILRARALGTDTGLIPLLYISMNVTYAVLAYPAGRLADRLGKARIVFGGYFLYAAVYGLFAVLRGGASLWILFPLYGLYLGLSDGVGRAYMATLLPQEKRATGFAFYHTVIGLTILPASAIAGWLWERFSPGAVFVTGALLSLAAGILFGLFLLRRTDIGDGRDAFPS